MKQSKEYRLLGYLNGVVVLETSIRVNSIKQAQQRFTHKYEAMLVGRWAIKILMGNSEVGSFSINKNAKPEVNKNVKRTLPNYWRNIRFGLNRGFGNIFYINDEPLHKVGDDYAYRYLRSGWSVQHLSCPVDRNLTWEES
jgi:hypothetical protein